jgi:hypothetical protein
MNAFQYGSGQPGGAFEVDFDDLDPERLHDVAIGRVARNGDRHLVARIEHGKEGEVEAGRGPGRHHHAVRRHVEPVMVAIVAGNRLPQFRSSERVRIAKRAGRECLGGRLANDPRRGVGWLADRERHHTPPRRTQRIGAREHIHGMERLDVGAAGNEDRRQGWQLRQSVRGRTNARLIWGSQVHEPHRSVLFIAARLD